MADRTGFLTSVERSPEELRNELDKYVALAEHEGMLQLAQFLKDVMGEVAIREVENEALSMDMRKMVDDIEILKDENASLWLTIDELRKSGGG